MEDMLEKNEVGGVEGEGRRRGRNESNPPPSFAQDKGMDKR